MGIGRFLKRYRKCGSRNILDRAMRPAHTAVKEDMDVLIL